MELGGFGFTFNGETIDATTYGTTYIPEFVSVLERHARPTTRRVLEWGSGLTTQILAAFATRRWTCDLLVTLDEFKPYQDAVLAGMTQPPFLHAAVMEQIGPRNSQSDQELTYSTYPLRFGGTFDLIVIDGRRRMECALIAAHLSHPDTVVIIHDYRRTRYQPILSMFIPIEDGPQFRMLLPRPEVLAALRPGIESVNAYLSCLATNGLAGI
jgi:hypothetical protein